MNTLHFDEAVRIAAIRRQISNLLPAYTDRSSKNVEVLQGLDMQVEQLAKAAGVTSGDIYEMVPLTRRPTLQELANEIDIFCIQAISPAGCPLHYTGRAGEGWLSPDVNDAFPFQTVEGAFRKMGLFAQQHRGRLIFNVINASTGEYVEEA
jgi:hypothetical protein